MFLWSPNKCHIYHIIYTLIESKIDQYILTKSNPISKILSLKSNKISTVMYESLDSRLRPFEELGFQIHRGIQSSYCHLKPLVFNRNQTSTLVDLGQTTFTVASAESQIHRGVPPCCAILAELPFDDHSGKEKHQQKSSSDVPTVTQCICLDSFHLGRAV